MPLPQSPTYCPASVSFSLFSVREAIWARQSCHGISALMYGGVKKKNHTEFSIKREEIMTEEISSLSMSISSHEEKWQCGLYITYSFLFPV